MHARIKCVRATSETAQRNPSAPFSLPIRIINSRSRRCSQLKLYVNDLQKLYFVAAARHYLLIIATSRLESRNKCRNAKESEEETSPSPQSVPVSCFSCDLELALSLDCRINFSRKKLSSLKTNYLFYLFLLLKMKKKSQ